MTPVKLKLREQCQAVKAQPRRLALSCNSLQSQVPGQVRLTKPCLGLIFRAASPSVHYTDTVSTARL